MVPNHTPVLARLPGAGSFQGTPESAGERERGPRAEGEGEGAGARLGASVLQPSDKIPLALAVTRQLLRNPFPRRDEAGHCGLRSKPTATADSRALARSVKAGQGAAPSCPAEGKPVFRAGGNGVARPEVSSNWY